MRPCRPSSARRSTATGPPTTSSMAEQLDFYGTSLYPKHSFPNTHWPTWQFNVAIDFSPQRQPAATAGSTSASCRPASACRGVVMGDPVTPEDHRVWMWSVDRPRGQGDQLLRVLPDVLGLRVRRLRADRARRQDHRPRAEAVGQDGRRSSTRITSCSSSSKPVAGAGRHRSTTRCRRWSAASRTPARRAACAIR